MANDLLKAIRNRVLLGDGAMGTELQAAGLAAGGGGEIWNIEHPDRVLAIQRAYVDAGSDCLITNTFGGCAITLERHGLADRVREINEAGVRIARQAIGDRGFVLGDIGPFGGMMEPLGDTPVAQVRAAFQEQADVLVDAGADAIIIETQTGLEELGLAIEAALRAGAGCVIASLSYDVPAGGGNDLRTMMGISPDRAAVFARDAGAHVIALNCGRGVDMHWASVGVTSYRSACGLPTMAQPNGGSPVMVDGKITYRQTPADMAKDLPQLLATGVNVVGACCGSTPAHIRALRPIIDEHNRKMSNK